MRGEAEQSIRRLEEVKRSEMVRVALGCIKREGGASRACLCNAAHSGGNSKGFVHVDLLSQYGVFSVYSVSRIWISDLFSLLPLSDFQHQDQYKSPSRNGRS